MCESHTAGRRSVVLWDFPTHRRTPLCENMAARAAAALASLGRVAEPALELLTGAASRPLGLPSLAAYLRRSGDASETKLALYRLQQTLKGSGGFNQPKFLDAAGRDYTTVIHEVSKGRWGEGPLRALLTDRAFALARRGAAEGILETGSRQAARIIKHLSPPKLVAARSLWAQPELVRVMQRGAAADPDFAQLTVQYHVLVQPLAFPAPAGSGMAGAGRGSSAAPRRGAPAKADGSSSSAVDAGSGEGTTEADFAVAPGGPDAIDAGNAAAVQRRAAEEYATLGEWRPVDSVDSGLVYWFNSATGARSWGRPAPGALVPRRPFRLEDAGFLRVLDAQSAAAAGAPHPFVAVTHNVVWERALKGPGASAVSAAQGVTNAGLWKVAAL